jgi:hypothetical protein
MLSDDAPVRVAVFANGPGTFLQTKARRAASRQALAGM